jgi:hypothetical protein
MGAPGADVILDALYDANRFAGACFDPCDESAGAFIPVELDAGALANLVYNAMVRAKFSSEPWKRGTGFRERRLSQALRK